MADEENDSNSVINQLTTDTSHSSTEAPGMDPDRSGVPFTSIPGKKDLCTIDFPDKKISSSERDKMMSEVRKIPEEKPSLSSDDTQRQGQVVVKNEDKRTSQFVNESAEPTKDPDRQSRSSKETPILDRNPGTIHSYRKQGQRRYTTNSAKKASTKPQHAWKDQALPSDAEHSRTLASSTDSANKTVKSAKDRPNSSVHSHSPRGPGRVVSQSTKHPGHTSVGHTKRTDTGKVDTTVDLDRTILNPARGRKSWTKDSEGLDQNSGPAATSLQLPKDTSEARNDSKLIPHSGSKSGGKRPRKRKSNSQKMPQKDAHDKDNPREQTRKTSESEHMATSNETTPLRTTSSKALIPPRQERDTKHSSSSKPEELVVLGKMQGNLPRKCAAQSSENTDDIMMGPDSSAIETKIYIKVNKLFDDFESVSCFLQSTVSVGGFHTQPEIRKSEGFTYCTLICHSKSKATKVMYHLNREKQKAGSCIIARLTPFSVPRPRMHNVGRKENPIEEAVFDFEVKFTKLIEEHDQLDKVIQQRIDEEKPKLKDLFKEQTARANIAAFEQKQAEVENQRKEFVAAVDRIKAQASSLQDKDDIKVIEQQFNRECNRFRKALPIYARRSEIVNLVKEKQVSVILGETGSGKSTQLAQYLAEAGMADSGVIVCTQPRRVAAMSLASHVAGEMLTRVGQEVGYRLGSKRRQSPLTKILYSTDHSLLNECLTDPDLKQFSCIIVDEAHERSLHTDLLLSMIKQCLPRRPELRVIITSATIDPKVFQDFFADCPVLKVAGRTFPVDVMWLPDAEENTLQENYCERAVQQAMEIHIKEEPGDVLVFVTSPAETEKCCQLLREKMRMRGDFTCMQLHGKQQSEEQQRVFLPTERGKRKIVFATNCAETSITIDGIKYVVDTGLAKEMRYDPRRNLNSLCLSTISQSSADQRKGRAGRTAPGKCYRLYSQQTYTEMDTASKPEILRMHLGHALLKLAELGVQQQSYSFVQSPSDEAIQAAIDLLEGLGAMHDGHITDRGRWIASLPFDPRLGLLTFLGKQQGILYDCAVLAAVMSAEGNLFYRGTSEEDHRVHDITKTRFSLEQGDCLSSLAVYKMWLQVPDKEKNRWCVQNGLNAKVLRGVTELVKEVCYVLGSQMGTQSFATEDKTEELRKLIVKCYSATLCHFLGWENAGYYAARVSRRVHFHPSSCLSTLAAFPEWVVYDQLIQTSRDFITGITPVEESWLAEMDERSLGFGLEDVRKMTIKKIFSCHVGSKAFFAIVGPSYTKLRKLEEDFCSSSNSVIFIEAIREEGEINVYCTQESKDTKALIEELETTISCTLEELEKDDREEGIAGSGKQAQRAVIGPGGQVQEILLSSQSRKLFIKRAPGGATEEMVRDKFKMYGEIKFCKQFEEGNNWGFLIFRKSPDAEYAARATSYASTYVGEVEHRQPGEEQTRFWLDLTWCRRPYKGYALVKVSPKFFVRCLRLKTFYVDRDSVTVTRAHGKWNRNTLYLTGITNIMSEALIERSLLHELGTAEDTEGIVHRITLPRAPPAHISDDHRDVVENTIRDFFMPHLKPATVYVEDPEPEDDVFTARVRFTDPIKGFAVFEKIRNEDKGLCIDEQPVEMKPLARANITVQMQIWELSHAGVQEAIALLNDLNVTIHINDEEERRRQLTIEASSIEDIVCARTLIEDVMRGQTIDCTAAGMLSTADGAAVLRQLEQETGAKVKMDRRGHRLTVYGTQQASFQMQKRLQELSQQVQDSQEHCLKGDGKPAGLMKAVILKYGEDLSGLVAVAGLQSATVNFRRHRLRVTGSSASLDTVSQQLLTLTEALRAGAGMEQPEMDRVTEDCSACMCPIDRGQLYRMEMCAHPYCKDCFRHQVHFAIRDQDIPIVCCHEGCERPLSIRDFTSLIRNRHLNMTELTRAAVSTFLKSSDRYRQCPSPDCPAVYEAQKPYRNPWQYGCSLTLAGWDRVFVCPHCGTSTCKSCHKPAHSGKACQREKADHADDSGVGAWAAEDSENRKMCPRCRSMIEKMDGCNKMVCRVCKAIFCWLCLTPFSTTGDCYDHLVKKHGGIFPGEYGVRQRYRPRRY